MSTLARTREIDTDIILDQKNSLESSGRPSDRRFRSKLEPPVTDNSNRMRSSAPKQLMPAKLSHKRSGSMISQASSTNIKVEEPPPLKRSNSSEFELALENKNDTTDLTLELEKLSTKGKKREESGKIKRIRIMGDSKTGKTSKNNKFISFVFI